MSYLLDTNACIHFLNIPNSPIRERLASVDASEIFLCSVVKSELWYGAERSGNPGKARRVLTEFFGPFRSLPFDDAAAEACGRIRAGLARMGRPIGANDLLISSIALSRQLTVVTANRREFDRVEGLDIVDWSEPSA